MPALSLLIKPASGLCGMRCTYCFYHSLSMHREIPSYGLMSEETLALLLEKAFSYAQGGLAITYQGGEPTLRGLDFFREAAELEKRLNRRRIPITHAIQTNGYDVDADWAAFLKAEGYLVGLSLDGYPSLHDRYRKDRDGQGTYTRVQNAMRVLNEAGVPFNILHVVTAASARQPEKIYRYYKENGLAYLQFIPCLDPYGESWGGAEYSLSADGWEYFHKGLFDIWYRDFVNGNYISIRYFDNLVTRLLGYETEICSMRGRCSNQWVVESDGSLYPCDFFVTDRWRIGNIHESDLKTLAESETVREFVRRSEQKAEECGRCKWYPLCRGGCLREREDYENGAQSPDRFCRARRNFFEYTYDRLLDVARRVRELR